MKRLRLISFLGVIFSLLAHLVSWTTPNILHFAMIGIPLHIVAIILMSKLYRMRVLPLQEKADLHWFNHASSGIHALMFLAVLSFLFHTIVVALQISVFAMFLIRAVSSIWLYVYTIGYAYTSWAGQHQRHHHRSHRTRIQQQAETTKSELHISQPKTMRWRN